MIMVMVRLMDLVDTTVNLMILITTLYMTSLKKLLPLQGYPVQTQLLLKRVE